MQRLVLEIFSDHGPEADEDPGPVPEQDPAGLPGFDVGYQAGWEAAVAEQQSSADREAAEVTRALQGLEFAFQEVRAHILKGMAPLIADIARLVLPKLASESLPDLVAEVLQPDLGRAADLPVEIQLHPDFSARLRQRLAAVPALPVTLFERPDLPRDQVTVRLGQQETRIDPGAAISAIEQLLSQYFDPFPKETRHG